jgi:hypothetical protein
MRRRRVGKAVVSLPLGSLPVAFLSLGLLAGCHERGAGVSGEPEPAARVASATLDREALARGETRTLLGALAMPHHYLATRLGSHRIQCSSTLSTTVPGQPPREVRQEVELRMDREGRFAATKNTHPQHGQEVIWTGDALYPRLRHGKFLRRPARAGEPRAIADRFAGLLPAYVGLLRRFLRVSLKGPTSVAGRSALKLELGLATSPPPPPRNPAPARAWRQSIVVSSLAGVALLDRESGAPLSVDLRARWSFHPPAGGPTPSGIPSAIDRNSTGTMELVYRQRVSTIGAIKEIAPPPAADTIDNPRRIRLELERQMLVGELPIDDEKTEAK